MKTEKGMESEAEINEEISGFIEDDFISQNLTSVKTGYLKRIVLRTIDLYCLKIRMDSSFIDDLKFVMEDFFDSFKPYENEY